jgi:hypothetical protein
MAVPDVLAAAGSVLVLAALVFAAATLAATRSMRSALPVLLDLLLAAGLLKLAVANSWQAIGSAALVVLIRKIAVAGLTRPLHFGSVSRLRSACGHGESLRE